MDVQRSRHSRAEGACSPLAGRQLCLLLWRPGDVLLGERCARDLWEASFHALPGCSSAHKTWLGWV